MDRYSFQFKVLTSRYPIKWNGPALLDLMETIRQELNDATATLNDVYDARFIAYAVGSELDQWGEILKLARLPGEIDTLYRARLLAEFRDFLESLTIEVLKDTIELTTGVEPECRELYSLIPSLHKLGDTPTQKPGGSQISPCFDWPVHIYKYDHLLTASFVIPIGLTPEQLNEIEDNLQAVKLATLRIYLVEDSGLGYYILKKEVL